MKHFFLLAIGLILLASCKSPSEKKGEDSGGNALRDTLLHIIEMDQYYRNISTSLEEQYGMEADTLQLVYELQHRQDSINLSKICAMLDKQGWPSKESVGDTAVLAPFFVLQHSSDPDIMNQYFPIVKAMVENGQLSPRILAYYSDRLSMLREEPQIFGTQLRNDPQSGKMVLYPILNFDSLDIRRKAADLGPINDYLRSMGADTLPQ